jgi:hypothetical protein
MKTNFIVLLFVLPLFSCSFVELLPGSHNIIYASNIASCEKLKQMEFSVATTTFFITRSEHAIAEELEILAQNEAIRSHANAIWPVSIINDGRQSFSILRCTDNE